MNVQADVREFLVGELGWSGERELLTDDYALIANGVLDSMGIFQLVSMIEDRYGVEVEDEELVPENFQTLAAVARLVGSKTSSA